MRILISNDDGIAAPGLAVLEEIARTLSDDIWICAPATEQSGASHSLTIHRPLRVSQLGDKRYFVDGTPTDCILLAVNRLMNGNVPDLVLSGINHGVNTGEDVTYSGTIAAAMEGTLLGIRSVAFSQQVIDRAIDWQPARQWGPKVLRRILSVDWIPGVLMNVNFPLMPPDEIKGIVAVGHGGRKIGDQIEERIDPRGRPYYWIGVARSDGSIPRTGDVEALDAGHVTVTPIDLDLTHHAMVDSLKKVLS